LPEAACFNRPSPAGEEPIANGSDGDQPQTPRARAAKRKQLKKKYVIKAGKLVTRTE
jgi:hypothetical protein